MNLKPARPFKRERTVTLLQELASKYLSQEANRTSLVTITNSHLAGDGSAVTFYLSVLPATEEEKALEFAKRKRSEVREYIQKNSKIGRIPFIDFELDFGEKNRQRVDELLAEDKNDKSKE